MSDFTEFNGNYTGNLWCPHPNPTFTTEDMSSEMSFKLTWVSNKRINETLETFPGLDVNDVALIFNPLCDQ